MGERLRGVPGGAPLSCRVSGRCEVQGRSAVRCDGLAVWQEFARVLEYDHAVAQEAPSLFGVVVGDPGGFAVYGLGGGAGWLVGAHCRLSGLA